MSPEIEYFSFTSSFSSKQCFQYTILNALHSKIEVIAHLTEVVNMKKTVAELRCALSSLVFFLLPYFARHC